MIRTIAIIKIIFSFILLAMHFKTNNDAYWIISTIEANVALILLTIDYKYKTAKEQTTIIIKTP